MEKLMGEAGDDAADLLALGRMVSFACQRARAMDLEFSTYCLELALVALMQDMSKAGVSLPANEPHAKAAGYDGLH